MLYRKVSHSEYKDFIKIKECTAVLEKKYDRLYYRNGKQIMGTFRGLSSDGLHPSDAGHTMIAQNLSNFMRAHGL